MKQTTISREVIEHILSRHYFNANGFEWVDNGSVTFYSNGSTGIVDVNNVLYENNQLKSQINYMQGALDNLKEVFVRG